MALLTREDRDLLTSHLSESVHLALSRCAPDFSLPLVTYWKRLSSLPTFLKQLNGAIEADKNHAVTTQPRQNAGTPLSDRIWMQGSAYLQQN